MIQRLVRAIRRRLGLAASYPSETSKVRHLTLPWCVGKGCDIGFGGDKVRKDDCVGIDLPRPYAATGGDAVDVPCDVIREPIPVPSDSFDYVYSSHMIEDVPDTTRVLSEFVRILRSGGNLVLVFPDQPAYERRCRETGQPLNTLHVHADMGLAFMRARLAELPGIRVETLFESDREVDYNVVIAVRIVKSPSPTPTPTRA
jgi:SAM-dependent methyltransferase